MWLLSKVMQSSWNLVYFLVYLQYTFHFSYDELFEEHQNETRPCSFFEHSTCVASIRNKKGFQIGFLSISKTLITTDQHRTNRNTSCKPT